MEKDYFADRSSESKLSNSINVGDTVYICEKTMQRSATKIDDLAQGVVVRKLTRHDHPRGIKVEAKCANGRLLVGRVVYLVRNNKIVFGK